MSLGEGLKILNQLILSCQFASEKWGGGKLGHMTKIVVVFSYSDVLLIELCAEKSP